MPELDESKLNQCAGMVCSWLTLEDSPPTPLTQDSAACMHRGLLLCR